MYINVSGRLALLFNKLRIRFLRIAHLAAPWSSVTTQW